MHSSPDQKIAYTVRDVAELLGVSTDKVYELVRGDVIPSKRIGRLIIIPKKPFETWLYEPDNWGSFGAC